MFTLQGNIKDDPDKSRAAPSSGFLSLPSPLCPPPPPLSLQLFLILFPLFFKSQTEDSLGIKMGDFKHI